MSNIELQSTHANFGGRTEFYKHESSTTGTQMGFSVFIPPQAANDTVPVVYYLAGLTCTEETFMIKSGAQRLAAKYGIMLVAPDTSPRGANITGEDDDWDFGTGAGFYLNATEAPWSANYKMYDYVVEELPSIISDNFSCDISRQGIFGHSMGGHGALTIALKNPKRYKSISAFAPIAAPMQCPWGEKAFSNYLGNDRSQWVQYDASELLRIHQDQRPVLIDQGLADDFLSKQLNPHVFEKVCKEVGRPIELRFHEGYDHGYYFISTFMGDHLKHHAKILNN